MIIATFALFALPAFADSISDEYGVSSAKVGLLTAVFAGMYAATQVPGGILGDVLGNKAVLGGALGVLGLSFLASTKVSSFELLLGLRAVSGLAAGMLLPVASSVIRAANPLRNTRAQAALGAGWGLGWLLSLLVLPILFSSWRQAFVVLGVAALATGLAVVVLLPGHPRLPARHALSDARAGLGSLGTWLLGAYLFGLAFANVGVGAWAIPFGTDELGLSTRGAGLLTALIAAGVFPAAVVGARVAHRWGVTVVTVSSAAAMAIAVVILATPVPLVLVGIAFFALGWSAAFPFGVVLGLVATVVRGPGSRAQGAIAGAVNGIGILAGMASPPIVGLIRDRSDSYAVGFIPLVFGPGLALVAAGAIAARIASGPHG